MEFPHEFNVEGFKRMAGRLDKVDTRMDTIIDDISPVGFILGFKVCIESGFDTFKDGLPTRH